MMHSPLKVNRCFEGTCHLHLQDWRQRWARNQLILLPTSASFLLALFFTLEYGGDTFLWNISWLSVDCMASYSRRQNSQKPRSLEFFAQASHSEYPVIEWHTEFVWKSCYRGIRSVVTHATRRAVGVSQSLKCNSITFIYTVILSAIA
jgi:hypothetical protein